MPKVSVGNQCSHLHDYCTRDFTFARVYSSTTVVVGNGGLKIMLIFNNLSWLISQIEAQCNMAVARHSLHILGGY